MDMDFDACSGAVVGCLYNAYLGTICDVSRHMLATTESDGFFFLSSFSVCTYETMKLQIGFLVSFEERGKEGK